MFSHSPTRKDSPFTYTLFGCFVTLLFTAATLLPLLPAVQAYPFQPDSDCDGIPDHFDARVTVYAGDTNPCLTGSEILRTSSKSLASAVR